MLSKMVMQNGFSEGSRQKAYSSIERKYYKEAVHENFVGL